MSTWHEDVESYLSLRRRLGFKLIYDGRVLADFAVFLEQAGSAQGSS